MRTYFRLLSFAKPLGRYIFPYACLAVFAVVFGLVNFTLLIPLLNILFGTIDLSGNTTLPEFYFNLLYFKDLFNYFFAFIVNHYGKEGALYFVCSALVVSVFLANLFRYTSQRVMTDMRTTTVKNIREKLFDKVLLLDLGFFEKQKKGHLISRLTNDVNEIETSVVSSVQVVFREPLMIIGYILLLFFMSVKLTVFTLIVLPVSGFFIAIILRKLRKEAKHIQEILGNILSIIEETLGGMRIIKGFNSEHYTKGKFEQENENHRKILKSMWNKKELASPVSEFLGVLVVAGVLLYGGRLVLQEEGELAASEFITYIILYSQILVPAKNISTAISNIQRGIASGERIFEILDAPVEIKEHTDSVSIKGFSESILYKNVSFAYENETVLKNISLKIKKGRIVALVGPSGAGKSTIADLLPRFYDCTEGDILVDGISIKKIKLKEWRDLVGIVTQESILFNDTIFNNIAFGVEGANEEDVVAAAKIANAHEFITEMENGYYSNIGDRGTKLSGGQRQRLSIARAVFKNPPVLILDEATSSLDTQSERLVQDALNKLMQNRTTLVIAHRLSTVQHADEIIVVNKGEIVEQGTHLQLLDKNGLYKKLLEMQNFN
jgi:ATP-binding cassette, subfamily B, bacterial MsbA